MSPSLQPGAYLHLVTPSLRLPPAREDVGEFVALPLCIQPPVGDIESLMDQTVFPSGTNRNKAVDPLPLLYTGLPSLHRPCCNLWERLMIFYKYALAHIKLMLCIPTPTKIVNNSDKSKPVVAHFAPMISPHATTPRHPHQIARQDKGCEL